MKWRKSKKSDRCPLCMAQLSPQGVCACCGWREGKPAQRLLSWQLQVGSCVANDFVVGAAADWDSICVRYWGINRRRNQECMIRELFVQGGMTREADGSIHMESRTQPEILLQAIQTFTKQFGQVYAQNNTYYVVEEMTEQDRRQREALSSLREERQWDGASGKMMGSRPYQEDASSVVCKGSFAYALVCDGMGGMGHGDLASKTCLQQMLGVAEQLRVSDESATPELLRQQALLANQAVYALRDERGNRAGCGSTLVAAVCRGENLYYLTVGDSRIYWIHENTIRQLNREHTLLEALIEQARKGEIDYEDAMENPRREALTSFIGIETLERMELTQQPLALSPGDRVLLCSDGVYRTVPNKELLRLATTGTCSEGVRAILAETARRRVPQQDNATCVLLEKPSS